MDPGTPLSPREPGTATSPTPRWGLGDFLFGLVAGYALASLFAAVWFAVSGAEELSIGGQAFTQTGLWTGMVGAVVLASRRKGSRRLSEDFGFRARWSDVGLGIVVALAVQLVVLPGLAYLLRPLLGEPEVSGPVRDLLDQSTGAAYLGLMVSVGLGAPIVEELFFRGLLLRSLQRRMPDALAVALSSVAFGLAHGSTLPADAVILVILSLTVFGAVLAVLAVRTGRLGASIVAHSVFNLFTILYLTFNG